MLVDSGITELIVIVGYRKADFSTHLGDTYEGIPIRYVRLEKHSEGSEYLH